MTNQLARRLRRYLVTDSLVGTPERLLAITSEALKGGMTAVQLRVKEWPDRLALDAAHGLRKQCTEAGALFLINDRVDLALAAGADGIHLGVDDLPLGVARGLLGPCAVIGYSPETPQDRIVAEQAGADYLGVGPVFGTTTKADAGQAIGIEGLRSVVDASPLPVVGIGGITIDNAVDVVTVGAVGVAVVGSVFFAEDPAKAASQLKAAIT